MPGEAVVQWAHMNNKKNVGKIDSIVRYIIAALLVIAYAMGWISGLLGIVALVVAVVMVVTGFIHLCPLYRLFGISTCAANE